MMDFLKALGQPGVQQVMQHLHQQQQKTSLQDIPLGYIPLSIKVTSAALSSSTASAGQLSGAFITIMTNTGCTPGTYTTRTAAEMFAESGLYPGQSYFLILANNQGTGTLTLAAGASGVTAAGTLTALVNAARLFQVNCSGTTAVPLMTFTGLALSWSSAV